MDTCLIVIRLVTDSASTKSNTAELPFSQAYRNSKSIVLYSFMDTTVLSRELLLRLERICNLTRDVAVQP